ncbi:hypothetical protein DFQ29_005078 [Apophysomyces sp. BC1021]|nr:hypothetical protein DFQ29_005078 [Apophysomyces sp. BC1021]
MDDTETKATLTMEKDNVPSAEDPSPTDGFEMIEDSAKQTHSSPSNIGEKRDKEGEEQQLQLPPPMQPITFRVMYMGHVVGNQPKLLVRKKLAEGLAEWIVSSSANPWIYREKKQNVVFLNNARNEPIETYDDSGLSLIEVDFTWTGPLVSSDSSQPYTSTLMALTSPPNVHEAIQAYLAHHYYGPSTMWLQNMFHKNSVYVDATANGVDLAVYFYGQPGQRWDPLVQKDMATLADLRSYGVPVLPLIVNSRQTLARPTTPAAAAIGATLPTRQPLASDRDGVPSPHPQRVSVFRPIPNEEDGRARQILADLLKQFGVACLNVTEINPDRPHFLADSEALSVTKSLIHKKEQKKSRRKRRTVLSVNEVMTVGQFVAIQRMDMGRILGQLREEAEEIDSAKIVRRLQKSAHRIANAGIQITHLYQVALAIIFVSVLLACLGLSLSGREPAWQAPSFTTHLHPRSQRLDENNLWYQFKVELRPNGTDPPDLTNQTLVVQLKTDERLLSQWPMHYSDNGFYAADIPSPCLLQSPTDLDASLWLPEYGTEAGERVALTYDACRGPVEENDAMDDEYFCATEPPPTSHASPPPSSSRDDTDRGKLMSIVRVLRPTVTVDEWMRRLLQKLKESFVFIRRSDFPRWPW